VKRKQIPFVIYDDRLHEEWCTDETPCRSDVLNLQDHILAALTIHRPCHDENTEPWHCEHGHADEACKTGIPDRPAVCVECTDGNEDHLPYPCPTAVALGVPPITSREDTTS
jgi:hypothetical protein